MGYEWLAIVARGGGGGAGGGSVVGARGSCFASSASALEPWTWRRVVAVLDDVGGGVARGDCILLVAKPHNIYESSIAGADEAGGGGAGCIVRIRKCQLFCLGGGKAGGVVASGCSTGVFVTHNAPMTIAM